MKKGLGAHQWITTKVEVATNSLVGLVYKSK